MPIQKFTIKGSDSGSVPPIDVDMVQYNLNANQQFIVLSVDFNKYPVEFENYAGVEYDKLGKLQDQSAIFQQQIINSLTLDGWDFVACANPEIVIMTNKKEI